VASGGRQFQDEELARPRSEAQLSGPLGRERGGWGANIRSRAMPDFRYALLVPSRGTGAQSCGLRPPEAAFQELASKALGIYAVARIYASSSTTMPVPIARCRPGGPFSGKADANFREPPPPCCIKSLTESRRKSNECSINYHQMKRGRRAGAGRRPGDCIGG
jgi:hypothetical protein